MDKFVPNFSELEKYLIDEDGIPVNDVAFFNLIKGTSKEGLGTGLVVDQSNDFNQDFYADNLDDDVLFDTVVPKSLQSLTELEDYAEMRYEQFKEGD